VNERPPKYSDRVTPSEAEAENAAFREDVARFRLVYRCGDCAHFAPVADRCSLGFQKEWFGEGPHRCRTEAGELVFCKYFELD
jgi:hypothetical protein